MEIRKTMFLKHISVLKKLSQEFKKNPELIEGSSNVIYFDSTFYESIIKFDSLLEYLVEVIDVAFEYNLEEKIIDFPPILEKISNAFSGLMKDSSMKGVENNIRKNDETMGRMIKNISFLFDRVELFRPYVFAVRINNNKNLEINRLLARYKELLPIIERIESIEAKTHNITLRAEDAASYIEAQKSELNTDIGRLTSTLKTIEEQKKNIDLISQEAKMRLEQIESNLLSQDDLSKNKEEISLLKKQASSLIDESKLALNLKNAEGISAAFASRVHSNGWWNKRLTPWLIGALIFVIIASALSYLLVVDTSLGLESIGKLVGRVIGVGLTVSAATFCAKQYTRQKSIEEDYHYKAILSKSITTFTEEIKKTDSSKVAEYLTHVLSEIHKDPLRERKNEDNVVLDANQFLEKLLTLVEKVK